MHNDSSFRNLKVWQLAMVLVEDVYRVTTAFRVQERFGLTSQLRRAAVSVPSNVGEGKRRKRQKAFAHHLDIALGSQGELEVQLEIAKLVGFLRDKHYARLQSQTEEVGRMLNGLLSSIQDQLEY
ncbi:MAG TPA: four helix bundle protein [Vicinamibacterales bacterium]|nr:four helix bundle protein [Vicinamibacterales bacterium]